MTAKKTHRRYVYMKWRVLVDPATGEEIRALVACSATDRRILSARRFRSENDYPELNELQIADFESLIDEQA